LSAKTKPAWARAIKQRRMELGLSQEEVALRSNLSPSLVAKLEQGRHDLGNVKFRNLYALLRALQWTPEEFAEATGLEIVPVYEHQESLGTATVSAPTSGAYVRATDEEIVGGFIRSEREKLGLSPEELAQRAGVEPDDVLTLESERVPATEIDPNKVAAIFLALGHDLGKFSKKTGLLIGPRARRLQPGERAIPEGYRLVEVIGAAQAGTPVEYAELIPEREYRPGTKIFHIEGDSMEPTLFEGDVVYVDTRLTEPQHGHIYVVEILGDGYTVKRAIRTKNGEWLLASDNPAYPALKPSEARIIGEVYRAKGERDLRTSGQKASRKEGRT